MWLLKLVVFGVNLGYKSCSICLALYSRLVGIGYGNLDGLHLVEDGLGELVCCGLTTHIAGANLAIEIVSTKLTSYKKEEASSTYPSAITP